LPSLFTKLLFRNISGVIWPKRWILRISI